MIIFNLRDMAVQRAGRDSFAKSFEQPLDRRRSGCAASSCLRRATPDGRRWWSAVHPMLQPDTAESCAAFLQTGGLRLQPCRFGHSSAEVCRQRHDRLSFRAQSPPCAMRPARSLGLSRADAPAAVTHQRSPHRYGSGQNHWPRSDSSRAVSLQLQRNFADKIFDPFSLMPVANQECIWRSNDNEVVNPEERDGCAVFLENYVVTGIDIG